ncbi:MAG: hypothetical protein U5L11_04565 [Arhodomonas sp.]|nr:hypothetical protein [Arhodomonas sp.]
MRGRADHYLPSGRWSEAPEGVLSVLSSGLDDAPVPVVRGASWTTDAPYRETAEAVAVMQEEGILAVEMEAAALYAFARSRERRVVCLAQVTNQMGQDEGDFEKGIDDGTRDALAVIGAVVRALGRYGKGTPLPRSKGC